MKKWDLFLRVAAQVCVWGVIALCFGESFRFGCVDMRERFTNEVDMWSPGEPPHAVTPLDHRFSTFEPTRLADGRLFMRARVDYDSWFFYEWDAQKTRFVKAASIPSVVPAGVDGNRDGVWPTPSGHVLVIPPAPEPMRLYDHGVVTPLARPSIADGRTMFPGAVVRPIELSDGALLVLGYDGYYSKTADLLEPHATAWKHLDDSAHLEQSLVFTAPGGKVLLLNEAPRLWDPRSDATEPLAGPKAMREGASAVSLDESHLLILGGTSTSKTPRLAFVVECVLAAVWLALGVFLCIRRLRTIDNAATPYITFGFLVGILPAAFIELAMETLVRIPWATK